MLALWHLLLPCQLYRFCLAAKFFSHISLIFFYFTIFAFVFAFGFAFTFVLSFALAFNLVHVHRARVIQPAWLALNLIKVFFVGTNFCEPLHRNLFAAL